VLMWSIVLVVVFYPVHIRILQRVRSPNAAAAISCALVIVTILLPLAAITVMVVRDAGDVAHSVQERKEALLNPSADTVTGKLMGWFEKHLDFDRAGAQQYLADRMRSMSGVIASKTLNIVGGVLGVLVQFFFVLFTMYYLFRDGETLRGALREMLPLDRWASTEVFLRTREVIQASIYGSLVIAVVQGSLGGVMFAILGVPSPLLWAAVMVFTCMIPMVGSALVWVPACLYLLAINHWIKAIVLAAWCLLVVSTIDNILRPKLVGGRTRLHELVVFFAVLGGIQVFGILGIITGPVIAAIALALFDIWRQSRPTAACITVPMPVE
jgi:predicted PurR-regulated permease PerM